MDAVNLSEKYIFLDLRSWEINIARTARRLGVSRNTVRHLQSLSSEEVLQQKERHYKLHAYEQAVASLLISLPSISSSRIGDYLREHYPDFRTSARRPSTIMSSSSGRSTTFLRSDNYRTTPPRSGSPVRHIHNP